MLVTKAVPPRTRRYLQGALVTGALITVIALPLIKRQDSQPQVKAILQQNFSANLAVLLGIVAGGALALYVPPGDPRPLEPHERAAVRRPALDHRVTGVRRVLLQGRERRHGPSRRTGPPAGRPR